MTYLKTPMQFDEIKRTPMLNEPRKKLKYYLFFSDLFGTTQMDF